MTQTRIRGRLDPNRTLTLVSGLPRAGTSMAMQMLEAAGLEVATDAHRSADDDNPRGYYELDVVKRLSRDASFLNSLVGQATKVVAPLLRVLPAQLEYRVIFMERDFDEVLASQRAMLDRQAQRATTRPDDDVLARAFARQIEGLKQWLAEQENFRTCFVSHASVLESPSTASEHLLRFLEETGAFATRTADSNARADALSRMAAIVDSGLYRQRRVESR